MQDYFFIPLLICSLILGFCIVITGQEIRAGITRSAAIQANMTAQQYADWMVLVDSK